jgi:CheY-like chemotaxis protein
MKAEPLFQRMKLLIVDDEPVNVALLEDMLCESFYKRIRSLTDSRAALETCAEFDPDLILLDLMMPRTSTASRFWRRYAQVTGSELFCRSSS